MHACRRPLAAGPRPDRTDTGPGSDIAIQTTNLEPPESVPLALELIDSRRIRMKSQTRRSLDGLLAIGRHPLDAQLRALTTYTACTGHVLGVVWALLPGEDPVWDVPDSGFPMVAFDDEIAGFTTEEYSLPFRQISRRAPSARTGTSHMRNPSPRARRATCPSTAAPKTARLAPTPSSVSAPNRSIGR
jgi:hypothetical protein